MYCDLYKSCTLWCTITIPAKCTISEAPKNINAVIRLDLPTFWKWLRSSTWLTLESANISPNLDESLSLGVKFPRIFSDFISAADSRKFQAWTSANFKRRRNVFLPLSPGILTKPLSFWWTSALPFSRGSGDYIMQTTNPSWRVRQFTLASIEVPLRFKKCMTMPIILLHLRFHLLHEVNLCSRL